MMMLCNLLAALLALSVISYVFFDLVHMFIHAFRTTNGWLRIYLAASFTGLLGFLAFLLVVTACNTVISLRLYY